MLISTIYQEIIEITQAIIGKGLTIQENSPIRNASTITWKDQKDISQMLRSMSYLDKYKLIIENENFNFKLLDGAIVQINYSFNDQGTQMLSHRLAYFPSPFLERYENTPLDYETLYFGNSEFHDIFEKYSITFPFRFDFSSTTPPFVDVNHPYSHLHLGEFEKCRIPVKGPIMPSQFVNFILRNFYNTAIVEYCDNLHFESAYLFDKTITEKEEKLVHLNFS